MDRFEELKKDELFISRLSKMTEPKEIVDLFAEKDIKISEEEAAMAISQVEDNPDGELTEESLEKASGGIIGYVLGLVAVIAFARGVNDAYNSKKACKP